MVENYVLQKLLDSANTDKIPYRKMNRLIRDVQRRQEKIQEEKYVTLKDLREVYITI